MPCLPRLAHEAPFTQTRTRRHNERKRQWCLSVGLVLKNSFNDTIIEGHLCVERGDLHAWVVRCKFNSGLKGIYVRDGIKIYVYSENELDEVAKSFRVYGGCRVVDSRRQYPHLSLILLCLNLYLSLPSGVLTSRKATIRGLPLEKWRQNVQNSSGTTSRRQVVSL